LTEVRKRKTPSYTAASAVGSAAIFSNIERFAANTASVCEKLYPVPNRRFNGRTWHCPVKEVIALIDAEIATLKEARAPLAAGSAVTVPKRKAGRPPKVQPDTTATPKRKKKRNLSPEGRARIAEAARKRWAAQRKAAK